jgi:hypothetical protein
MGNPPPKPAHPPVKRRSCGQPTEGTADTFVPSRDRHSKRPFEIAFRRECSTWTRRNECRRPL